MKANWIRTAGLVIAALAATVGFAQDYPALAGDSARLGHDTSAGLNGAGRALLTWYAPLINDVDGYTIIRNDLSSQVTLTGIWNAAASVDEAPGSYVGIPQTPTVNPQLTTVDPIYTGSPVQSRINYQENQLQGLVWYGPGPIPTGWSAPPQPSYRYAATVPSAADPTVKQFAGDTLSTFEWAIQPAADPSIPNQRFARNYALYAYINIGPTGDGAGGLIFPQRFYVYQIVYDGTKTFTDIVDTYAAGTGWVRLGARGTPTNKLFTYNGVDPIRIRLLNTVPRLNGHETDLIPAPYPLNDKRWLNTYADFPYSSVVYADAVKAVPLNGEYSASPIVTSLDPANLASPVSVFDARNEYLVGQQNGTSVTATSPVLRRRDHNTGNTIWSFRPLAEQAQFSTTQDNNSAGVAAPAPWFTTNVEPGFQGTNYLKAPVTLTPGTENYVTYTPTLTDGTYEILAWMPGSRGTETLARQVVYQIDEGLATTQVIIDQSVRGGWVRLGTRRFTEDNAGGNLLRVRVSNLSNNGADTGRETLTDAIRFVGAANLSFTSTPVHKVANVIPTTGGVPTATPIILAGTEDGKLFCLDAAGNGDGTTNVYWTYPSTPDPNNPGWTDPNAVAAEDGGIAEMPTGFDLSSALIETIGGADYLFIASKNGRVYCIEMAGRGDMDLTRRVPGTTRRVWSYPNDYPAGAVKSALGSFTGSLTYGVTAAGPTIFVGAPQGRMIALEAKPAVVTNKTTNVRWAFPAFNQKTLGAIRMTPVFFNNAVFFGTDVKTGDDRGRFFSLNADTGAINWQFNGTTLWSPTAAFVNADGFTTTPATATALQLGGTDPDMIYVANENRWITALDMTTGTVMWTTDELNSPVSGGMTTLQITAFDGGGTGTRQPAVLVMCPTQDGRYAGLFAKSGAGFGATNIFGQKLGWAYDAAGAPLTATMASGRAFLYGVDTAGYIYAFNDLGNGFGQDIDGPGQQEIVPNDDSNGDITDFRQAKLVFVTKDTYQRLRLPDGDPNHLTYAQATAAGRIVLRPSFDWGETIYALAFNFPYLHTYTQATGLIGTEAPPPYVNFQFAVEGAAIRNLTLEARQFENPTAAPNGPNGSDLDGYACLAYIIQSGGSNSMPPGNGRATFSISTTATSNPPRAVNITLDPANSRRDFVIANPLGLIMVPGDPMRQLGNTTDPSDPEVQRNGSYDIPASGKREDLMTTVTPQGSHGNAANTVIGVIDRSLMTLLRGPGRGLDNIRFSRSDLSWQGGKAQVLKRIDSIPFYAAFYASNKGLEDYPDLFPNVSLDYPDIQRENILVVKDINGQPENPIFGPISLFPPINVNETVDPPSRNNVTTPFDLTVSVPRFQPANLFNGNVDSGGAAVVAGYYGSMSVFVDSNSDGLLSKAGGRREAFRSFWLGSGVTVDERFSVETPVLDLGSLANSTGYDPGDPRTGTSFSPWSGPYVSLFRPIIIRNEGNVNLLNLRLAKFYANGAVNPWEIFSTNNHELAWLDSSRNIHATFDTQFALTPSPVLPKARPGDNVGTTFRDNPHARDNANINAIAGPLLAGPDPENPRVAVTLPLGFPSGSYSQMMRVIEDSTPDETLPLSASGVPQETISEPGFILRFTPTEARATNSYSTQTAPWIDDLVVTGAENFFHSNVQPAGMRSSGGSLVGVFASDRTGAAVGAGFDKAQPTNAVTDQPWRLFFGSVRGITPGAATGSSPLADLNGFTPQAGRWFRRDVADYPTNPPGTLFPGDPVVAGTVKFGGPNLPALGDRDPYSFAPMAFTYVGFVGQAQKQGASERYGDSRVFVAQMTVAADGTIAVGNPIGLPNDPGMSKGRPALFQSGNQVTAFFTVYGTGQTQIHYATYDSANWSPTKVFQVGPGFESVGAPSVFGRVYTGASGASPQEGMPNNNTQMLEVAFTGKLRGRSASEIFISRMGAAGVVPGAQYYFPARPLEVLQADTEPGTYRVSGLDWNQRANAPQLFYSLNNAPPVNIEVGGTRQTDRTSGIISFDTTLGGKAYLDPSLGTVRLSSSLPARNAVLFLTYQPRFLRVSATTAGYSGPSLMFDDRLIGDTSYWANNTNTGINPGDPVHSGRYLLTYNRAAAGAGQAPRPYIHSLRLGVKLPTSVATLSNGNLVNITITGVPPASFGAGSFYQVDPANGRVYFTADMENRTVHITYTGFDDAGNQAPVPGADYKITLMTEQSEAPVLMNQAVNESQLTTFMDPFDQTPTSRRPGLLWMLWTSTRTGTSDVFFQTIAPRFTPIAGSRN